jgi:molybdopterin-guanine dinucleotide biosynthesis protein A
MNFIRSKVALVHFGILAGGDSRRWAGYPKALGDHFGLPLAQVMVRRLARAHPLLGLCVRADQLSWAEDLSLPLVIEPDSDFPAGPMKGAWSLLRHAQAVGVSWVLVSACDMPWLPLDIGRRLHRLAQTENTKGAVLCDALGRHNLCFLLHLDCIPAIEQLLQQGEQRVGRYLSLLALSRYTWQYDPAVLMNRNKPE